MADKDLSGTDTAAAETGQQGTQDQQNAASAEQTAAETAPEKEAGQQTAADEAAAQQAAEEATERERNIRASKEGTPEWFQKKIDKVVNRAKAAEGTLSKEREARIRAEAERDLYKNLVEKGVVGKSGEKTAAADKGTDDDPRPIRPRMKDFESAEEYEEAQDKYIEDLNDWKHRERERDTKAAADRKKQEEESTKRNQTASERQKAFVTRRDEILDGYREEFGGEVADQLETAPPDTPIGSGMQEAIWESNQAPKILKYLFDHKDEATKIARMSNTRQAVEIDRIEKLVTAPPRKTTNAPPAVRPGSGGTPGPEDLSSIKDDAEWYRKRQQKTNSA